MRRIRQDEYSAVSEMASLFGAPGLVFFRSFFEDAALGLHLNVWGSNAGGCAYEGRERLRFSLNSKTSGCTAV